MGVNRRKRKRVGYAKDCASPDKSEKRRQIDIFSSRNVTLEEEEEEAKSGIRKHINPIEYWTIKQRWPKEYLSLDSSMDPLLARKKSTSSLRRKESESNNTPPTDGKSREAKSVPYKK